MLGRVKNEERGIIGVFLVLFLSVCDLALALPASAEQPGRPATATAHALEEQANACAMGRPECPTSTPTSTLTPVPTSTATPEPEVIATPTDTPTLIPTPEPWCRDLETNAILYDEDGIPQRCDLTPERISADEPQAEPLATDTPVTTATATMLPIVQSAPVVQVVQQPVYIDRVVYVYQPTTEPTDTPTPVSSSTPTPTRTPTASLTPTVPATSTSTPSAPSPTATPEPTTESLVDRTVASGLAVAHVSLLDVWIGWLGNSIAGTSAQATGVWASATVQSWVTMQRPLDPGSPPPWNRTFASFAGIQLFLDPLPEPARWFAYEPTLPPDAPDQSDIDRFMKVHL